MSKDLNDSQQERFQQWKNRYQSTLPQLPANPTPDVLRRHDESLVQQWKYHNSITDQYGGEFESLYGDIPIPSLEKWKAINTSIPISPKPLYDAMKQLRRGIFSVLPPLGFRNKSDTLPSLDQKIQNRIIMILHEFAGQFHSDPSYRSLSLFRPELWDDMIEYEDIEADYPYYRHINSILMFEPHHPFSRFFQLLFYYSKQSDEVNGLCGFFIQRLQVDLQLNSIHLPSFQLSLVRIILSLPCSVYNIAALYAFCNVGDILLNLEGITSSLLPSQPHYSNLCNILFWFHFEDPKKDCFIGDDTGIECHNYAIPTRIALAFVPSLAPLLVTMAPILLQREIIDAVREHQQLVKLSPSFPRKTLFEIMWEKWVHVYSLNIENTYWLLLISTFFSIESALHPTHLNQHINRRHFNIPLQIYRAIELARESSNDERNFRLDDLSLWRLFNLLPQSSHFPLGSQYTSSQLTAQAKSGTATTLQQFTVKGPNLGSFGNAFPYLIPILPTNDIVSLINDSRHFGIFQLLVRKCLINGVGMVGGMYPMVLKPILGLDETKYRPDPSLILYWLQTLNILDDFKAAVDENNNNAHWTSKIPHGLNYFARNVESPQQLEMKRRKAMTNYLTTTFIDAKIANVVLQIHPKINHHFGAFEVEREEVVMIVVWALEQNHKLAQKWAEFEAISLGPSQKQQQQQQQQQPQESSSPSFPPLPDRDIILVATATIDEIIENVLWWYSSPIASATSNQTDDGDDDDDNGQGGNKNNNKKKANHLLGSKKNEKEMAQLTQFWSTLARYNPSHRTTYFIISPPKDDVGSSGSSGGVKKGAGNNNNNSKDNSGKKDGTKSTTNTQKSSSDQFSYIDDFDYTMGVVVSHCSKWTPRPVLEANYQSRYGDYSTRAMSTRAMSNPYCFDSTTRDILVEAYRKGQDEMRVEGTEGLKLAAQAKKVKDLEIAEEERRVLALKQREEKAAAAKEKDQEKKKGKK